VQDSAERRRLARGSTLLLALLCAASALRAADEPAVRFVKPRELATVLGPTTIELEVDLPENATIARIELLADGKRIATITEPPWATSWDAGTEGRAHLLEALLLLDDGRRARATRRTSRLVVNQVEDIDLVNLYVVVRDRAGRHVTDLLADDFAITEDNVAQSIERFTTTDKPLRVALVLDCSLSMEKDERLGKAQKAALAFLDILGPADEGIVVSFNDTVQVAQDLSSDKVALGLAIEGTRPSGGTALYDAVWKTARLLESFEGRRVLVLLSDGRDEASSGLEPGSLHTVEEALDQALRSEVMIFPIGLGRDLGRTFVRRWDDLQGLSNLDTSMSVAALLERLADSTGGRAVMSADPGRLRKAFEEIATDLRHQYSIAYSSTNSVRDGKWRAISLTAARSELEIVTRKGYYARKPEKTRR